MIISLSWLRDFLSIDLPATELENVLVSTGLEVEGVFQRGVAVDHVIVGCIRESVQHPDADRLSVCQVDDGSGSLRQIVCGAKNYKVGDRVPLALPGAVLPGDFKIKVGKLRGVKSEGMMCSGRELGLSQDSEGLLILDPAAPVGMPLRELFAPETVFELGITPNRPDWLSHFGVARELAIFLGLPLQQPSLEVLEFSRDSAQARIEEGAACTFYSIQRWGNVRVAASPEWLRKRIESIGLRSINNVVDVTNYVLHEFGQPLHAFDAAKVRGAIRVRRALEGEEFVALDGSKIVLTAADTVIADDLSVLALAGVMGGLESGVTEATKEILLESAAFIPTEIRRTARRVGIQSDSSYRFERGVDPGMVMAAAQRAADLLVELDAVNPVDCLGRFSDGMLDVSRPDVKLRHERCRSLLGTQLADEEIIDCLGRNGLSLLDFSDGISTWQIPSHRADLTREVDLIEDVMRIIGIQRIDGRVGGGVSARTAADHKFDFLGKVRGDLISRGFFEARLSTLVSPTELPGDTPVLALKNPLGGDQSILRPTLIPGLLGAARRNFHAGIRDIRLFETGKIYLPAEVEEVLSLGIVASGSVWGIDWRLPAPPPVGLDFIKGLLSEVFAHSLEFVPASIPGLVVGARIVRNGIDAGMAGILAPATSRILDAPGEVIVAEIRLDSFLEFAQIAQLKKFEAFPRFPAITRDLSLVVQAEITYSQLDQALAGCKEPLLVNYAPFDVFRDETGQKLAADKKAVAVSLTFQSKDRTLESAEIDAAVDRIRVTLEEKLGAQIRS